MTRAARLRALLRPVLAIVFCTVLAGLADEWALRTWQRGGEGDETVGRVLAFNAPALAHTARSADPHSRGYFRSQVAVVMPVFGPRAGQVLASRVLLGPNPASNLVLQRGMLVTMSPGEGTADAKLLKPPLRYRWALVAAVVLAATLVVAGGRVGLRVLVVMAAAAALMVVGLVPLLTRGWSPLPTTGLLCAALLAGAFAISGAMDRKALAAIAGCAIGLAVAAALAVAFSWWLELTGTQSVTARFLEWVEGQVGARYDYAGLAAGSLLVALFGLALDTSVTVSAGVAQVCAAGPAVPQAQARKAGLNIAGDVVGTMVLTLVFAFLGVELPVFLMPHVLGLSPAELVSSEAGASALLHVLVGAAALAATGAATAVVAPLLMAGRPAAAAQPPGRRWPWACAIYGLVALAIAFGGVQWARMRAARVVEPSWSPPSGTADAAVKKARGDLADQQLGQAVLTLWTAIEQHPEEPRLRAELAYAFMSQRWLAQAEREVDAALATGADDAQTHYVAGVVRAWTGRLAEAERHLRRALELDPSHAAARAALDQLFGPSLDPETSP
ncbi:MAG: YibE/F family protein [bacterium]